MSETKMKNKFPAVDGKFVRFEADYTGYKIVSKAVVTGPGMIAQEMILRWGMVAGAPDAEDSAGRAKLRLQSPEELIERACSTAQIFWDEAIKRGWMESVPQPKEESVL